MGRLPPKMLSGMGAPPMCDSAAGVWCQHHVVRTFVTLPSHSTYRLLYCHTPSSKQAAMKGAAMVTTPSTSGMCGQCVHVTSRQPLVPVWPVPHRHASAIRLQAAKGTETSVDNDPDNTTRKFGLEAGLFQVRWHVYHSRSHPLRRPSRANPATGASPAPPPPRSSSPDTGAPTCSPPFPLPSCPLQHATQQ